MKDKVYLVGQISANDTRTYHWRKDLINYFTDDKQFYFIDPCRNEYSENVVNKYSDGSDPDRTKVYKTKGVELIVPKDKTYVMRSTMAVANLNHYDKHKPLIGTMFELAWYHNTNHKAVIGLYDGDPNEDIYCNHPFVKSVITYWAKDIKEVVYILNRYFRI